MKLNIPGCRLWEELDAQFKEAGIVIAYQDGDPQFDVESAQAIADAFPLLSAKREIISEIDSYAKQLRDLVVSNISPAEMASWSIKRTEALNYDGMDTSVPMLAVEAAARGITTQEIVDKVLAKANALAGLEANISGVCGKHSDAVKNLETFEEVAAYNYRLDWPV